MSKRITVTVEWSGHNWRVWRDGELVFDGFPSQTKAMAVNAARAHCRITQFKGGLAELIIKTRSGRIGKGSGSRATYGRDPRRHKG